MTSGSGHKLRVASILPTAGDAYGSGSPAAKRTRGFDYERLLRGPAPVHRPLQRIERRTDFDPLPHAAGDAPADETPEPRALSPDAASPQPEDASAAARHSAELAQHTLLGKRIADAAAPLMSALVTHDQQAVELVGRLARGIAAFCGDAAVVEAGHWYAQVPLDASVLPNTTLYLALSPFVLELRFDADSIEAKQLILSHSAMLEAELNAVLRAWGEPRIVELTVS
ncbi:type III secretion system protein SctP [Paraburkholderia humisilvae]|uniref:Type III secretion protein HpaP n=1 Tax=Paraburkholderia humisilvae TaxID=627669 RepID=A0A6J5EF94_9BURK|nr:type III secretion system protein SctP [Paraburkholderia humisilvae]CAB3764344.1 hypothetical protein LMG29542_04871 [Paraburkholderia humisilvae]